MSQINANKAKLEETANAIEQLTNAGVPRDEAIKQVVQTKPLIIKPSSSKESTGSSIIKKLQENAKNIAAEKEAKKPLNKVKDTEQNKENLDGFTGAAQSSKKQQTIAIVAVVVIAIIIAAGVLWGIKKSRKGGK